MNITENQITIIEITADYLYLIIVGDKKTIEYLVNEFEKNKGPHDTTRYLVHKIDIPIADQCEIIERELKEKNINKTVVLNDGIEKAQCHAYAEGYNNQSYIMMILEDYENQCVLGFPKFELDDEGDPDKIIVNWFKKKINYVPINLRKNIKAVILVGKNNDILVITSQVRIDKPK